jgi:hypothetical protein
MAHIQGKVTYLFDNRKGKDGTISKFPNFKFKIGDQELVLWASEKPDFLVKDALVSCSFGHSKKTGSAYIVNDPETKRPLIQALTSAPVETKPDTTFNVDDFEAENFNTAVTTIQKDIDSSPVTNKVFNKDEYMFVMALAKSIIESGKVNVNKEEVDLLIKDLKFLFKVNFGN